MTQPNLSELGALVPLNDGSKLQLERVILRIIQTTLQSHSTEISENEALRKIKSDFAKREFTEIFESASHDHLWIYFKYYVASRALGYTSLFMSHPDWFKGVKRVVGLGAGAGSECLAFRLFQHMQRVQGCKRSSEMEEEDGFYLTMHDMADWMPVLSGLNSSMDDILGKTTATVSFEQTNLLQLFEDTPESQSRLQSFTHQLGSADMVTSMFLLNELLTVDKRGTVQLITTLVQNMRPGSLLLAVESAGSFSHVHVKGTTYMAFTLLDHIQAFETVYGCDSQWYRYPQALKSYANGLPLDNMRYCVRVFRKKKNQGE